MSASIHDALRAACAEVGILYRDVPIDGRWHPTDVDGDRNGKGDGRIKLFQDGEGGIVANWKGELRPFFVSNGRELTDAERRERDRRRADAIRKSEAADARRKTEAATKASAIWEAAKAAPAEHPYLVRKRIQTHGIRIDDDGRLLIQVRDPKAIHSLQFIGSDGDKRFLSGGRVAGCYYGIGTTTGAKALCLCEGFATAASVHEATGHPVAVAFNAGNLEAVARAFRTMLPDLPIVVCADDDVGTEGNPGRTKATAAARAVGGIVAIPDFGPDRQPDQTDFNDLHLALGPEAVRVAIEAVLLGGGPEPDDQDGGGQVADGVDPRIPSQDAQGQGAGYDHDEGEPHFKGHDSARHSDRRITLDYELADEIGDRGGEADELIERLLTRGAMSVLYGDSNSGKTFAAIDVGAAVGRGIKWMDRHVEPGMVVYLASESPASVRMRLRAYQKHHDVKVPNFVIVKSPVDLFNRADDTDSVIALVRKLEQDRGVKCELIIGDTLSRLSAGANENSGQDMSVVVRHVDRIRQECAAHFLLIHHSGKNQALGARGWSGLRAATDTEIEVTSDLDAGVHAAEITKQRDIPGKGDRIGFRLQVVELGIGKWHQAITSCVVIAADAPIKQSQAKRPSEIAGAIVEFLSARGSGIRKRELVEHFEGRYTGSAIYREIKKMIDAKKLHEVVGILDLVQR